MTLGQKQREFTRLVGRLIAKIYAEGYAATFGETYRTPEQAALNAQKGIGIANSLHTQRLAVDLNLFNAAGEFLPDSESHRQFGEWWESQSCAEYTCCWGGRFGDCNHYSIAHEGRK